MCNGRANKINNRIIKIKKIIKSHQESIAMLRSSINRKKFEFQMGYRKRKDRIVSFKCIPFSEKRYESTLRHLNNQIILLNCELVILIKYGI